MWTQICRNHTHGLEFEAHSLDINREACGQTKIETGTGSWGEFPCK